CDSDPSTWSYINDHVHFHIGQWYASLGIYDVAVKHMMEILACSHQSKATQELFLSDFLQTVKVGDVGHILDLMAVVLENISISTLLARTTISAVYQTAKLISYVPNVSYQKKASIPT
ncbi:hypothetical protein HN51_034720, partial [Arachis hypogaea]